jgi:hypothetical protein
MASVHSKRSKQQGDQDILTVRSLLPIGLVFEIKFETFTPRITIRSERELTVDILTGSDIGFSDTVAYEAVAVRDGLVMLSWQEHIGSTIVHVLDFNARKAYTAVTPAKGKFMRLTGAIEIKSDA